MLPLTKEKESVVMIKVQEKYIPEEFHHVDLKRVKMEQDNKTDWCLEAVKVHVMDSISMSGKLGGIDLLFRRLVDFSCDADAKLRIIRGSYQFSGHVNVYRGNMLHVIKHLLHEIDLLASAVAHHFRHNFTVTFTCKQTIEFCLAA